MDESKAPEKEPREKPLGQITMKRCDDLIDHYLGAKMMNLRRSTLAQTAALIFTAAIPVVLLMPWTYVKMISAGLSALAAIATGLLAINGWRENFIRCGYIYHMLQIEKYLYEARASREYPENDPGTATRNFARRIEALVMMDITEWRAQMRSSDELSPRSEPSTATVSDRVSISL